MPKLSKPANLSGFFCFGEKKIAKKLYFYLEVSIFPLIFVYNIKDKTMKTFTTIRKNSKKYEAAFNANYAKLSPETRKEIRSDLLKYGDIKNAALETNGEIIRVITWRNHREFANVSATWNA